MGRVLRTRWDLLKPDRERTVTTKQAMANQKESHDIHARARELDIGETVMARNPKPWLPAVSGIVKKHLRPLTYLIETTAGLLWKWHINLDKILPSESSVNMDSSAVSNDTATEATPTERRYPQREHWVPLRYRSENFRH